MHGNVGEWTRDLYDGYKSGVFVNPPVSDSGNCKSDEQDVPCVIRGVFSVDSLKPQRSALRDQSRPGSRALQPGFRCVRVPPQPLIH